MISLKVVYKGRKMYEKHYETQFSINGYMYSYLD